MRRRFKRPHFTEPSLVPMADMLTNTVGIIIFILIFTVLTAGGALIAKRLPMERATKAQSLDFFCAGNRVLPMDSNRLAEEFARPFERTVRSWNMDDWISRFNERKIEDEYFEVTGNAMGFAAINFFRVAVVFTPKPGKGEIATEMRSPDSRYRQVLKKYQPSTHFVNLFVRPDSIAAFEAARAEAAQMGFSVGWWPLDEKDPARISMTSGGGRSATIQ